MITTKIVLLAKRSDGKFLKLDEHRNTTDWSYVDDPELATRIDPANKKDFKTPEPAAHYFENSFRAREIWVKDCVMVPYEITTEITAVAL